MAPKVYILILNYRNWADTLECLETVFRQDYPNTQVMVVDNGSMDDSLDRIRSWAAGQQAVAQPPGYTHGDLFRVTLRKPIPYVEYDRCQAERGPPTEAPFILIRAEENLGFSGGNNLALRYAMSRGDAGFVWLLNNDTVIQPDSLSELVQQAQSESSLGILGSKVLHYDRPNLIQLLGGGTLHRWKGITTHLCENQPNEQDSHAVSDVDYICGASMLVRTEVLSVIGLLDEQFFLYCEDLDWCLRASAKGWKMGICPGSILWHKGGGTTRHRSPRQDYYAVRNALLIMRKYFPRRFPTALLYSLCCSALPKIVRLQGGRLSTVFRAYRDALIQRTGKVL